MSNLLNSIQVQGGTLGIFRRGADVSANNISNASSPGFHRQSIQIEARGRSLGAEYLGTQRAGDALLMGRELNAHSEVSYFEKQSAMVSQLSPVLSDPGTLGLGTHLDSFFGALSDLAARPSDNAVRQQLLDRGSELGVAFEDGSRSLQNLRAESNQQINGLVREVNSLAENIAEANRAIVAEANPDAILGLQDRRDADLLRLSELVDIQTQDIGNGEIHVFAANGMTLVQGVEHRQLNTVADVNGNINIRMAGGAEVDITARIRGGEIGGLVAFRDSTIASAETQLNTLASDIINAVNTIHAGGSGLDGVTGRNFFEVPLDPGRAAENLRLDGQVLGQPDNIAASATPFTGPDNNTNAQALSDLQFSLVASGATQTLSEAANEVVGDLARFESSVDFSLNSATNERNALQSLREQVTGVSIEEQLLTLDRFQSSYTATLRVVQVFDEMVQNILNI